MNEVKKCTNCRFREAEDYKEEPCCSCQCCSKWEPKEEKSCRTCEFDRYDSAERPCRHCRGYSEWQSKDSKIKAGDKTLCKECFSSEIKVPQVFTTPNMIKDVIFSDPATIIFWNDGTKTVVKTQDGEKYDKEKGFAMAVCKKVFGNKRDYYHVFKRWMIKGKEVKHKEATGIVPWDVTMPKEEVKEK